eukprot:3689435-Pyramimonas_sp.AAC.1
MVQFLGNIATFAGLFIAALAIMVGFFASGQYNDGAVPVDFQRDTCRHAKAYMTAAGDGSTATAVRIALEQGKGDF